MHGEQYFRQYFRGHFAGRGARPPPRMNLFDGDDMEAFGRADAQGEELEGFPDGASAENIRSLFRNAPASLRRAPPRMRQSATSAARSLPHHPTR